MNMMFLLLVSSCKKENNVPCPLYALEGKAFLTALVEMESSIQVVYGEPLVSCLENMLEQKQYKHIGNQLYLLRHGYPPESDPNEYLSRRVTDRNKINYYPNARLFGYWVGALQVAVNSVFYNSTFKTYCFWSKARISKAMNRIFKAAVEHESAEYKSWRNVGYSCDGRGSPMNMFARFSRLEIKENLRVEHEFSTANNVVWYSNRK